IGGILSGLLVYIFAPDASGMGTDSMISAFHHKEGKMNARVPIIKSLATIVTLSTGGSGGKEGPIAQIGAGFGAFIADLIKAGARARRTLLLAGTAGGLGAIFHAPLGGALTAAEMVYKEDVESDALVPCIISSSTAYLVSEKIFPKGTVFHLKQEVVYSYQEFPFYILLGVLCYLFGKGFIAFFNHTQKKFENLRIPGYIKPAIGGFLVGLVALFFPESAGTGEHYLQRILNGEFFNIYGSSAGMAFLLFFILFILKMLTTSFTIGSGGSAGVFGPSLFAGGMVGGAVAVLAGLFLGPVSEVGFMLVGMGAFYSGIASAPIAGMIMVCEMIGSYELLPPLMIVTIISFTLSNKMSIYRSQLLNRFSSPAHFWDMNHDIMANIRLYNISEYLRRIALVKSDTPLKLIEKKAEEFHASDFIVINNENQYFGFFSMRKMKNLSDARSYLGDLILVQEVADQHVPAVVATDTLKDAFNVILNYDIDKVAVTRTDGFVLGYLKISDLFNIYYKYIKKK
ncbi:MAG: chloride channel protein, partial [Leptospiraceae bacterium]|nr:chloride channel protein [Leptospiraceae bacterium]